MLRAYSLRRNRRGHLPLLVWPMGPEIQNCISKLIKIRFVPSAIPTFFNYFVFTKHPVLFSEIQHFCLYQILDN